MQKSKIKKQKSYKFVEFLSRILQPIFNILFYIAVVFIFLFIILSIILSFVHMPVDEMLLPPFMDKVQDGGSATAAYAIYLGNGVKITTDAENVTLENIKTVFFAGINVVVFILLTIAPIFKFTAALLYNINTKKYFDLKNARYLMFIGLCVSVGTVVIRFMTQFYNYYLLTQFITDAPQEIALQLRIDILSGITGLVIIFTGLIFAYVCQIHNENQKDEESEEYKDNSRENKENISSIVKK